MPKQYRIGFADEQEYKNFIKEKSFEIIKKNDKYCHIYISVADNEITKLFCKLKNHDIRYIKYNPYSLGVKGLDNLKYATICTFYDYQSILTSDNDWIIKMIFPFGIAIITFLIGGIVFKKTDLPL